MAMRTICVILVDRANYGRLQPVMRAIQHCPDLELQVLCGGTMVLNRFKRTADELTDDGFPVDGEFYCEVEQNMARSIGLTAIEVAGHLERLKPDFCLMIGDRYEAMGAAAAVVASGSCLVHIQGGEVSGTLDEQWRHAITKLAHYHAPATEQSKSNILAMGERENTIISVGCPVGDLAREIGPQERTDELLVMFHPNTAEQESIEPLLAALDVLERPTRLFWPNIDAGANEVQKAIRRWRGERERPWLTMVTHMPAREFLKAMASAACCVGNSSSFVRDAGFFGTPVLLYGFRQRGRERPVNVSEKLLFREDVSIDRIIERHIILGPFGPDDLYGDGHVSERIVSALQTIEPYKQKRLAYGEVTV